MKHLKFLTLCALCAVTMGCQKANKYTLNASVPDEWDGGTAYLAHFNGRNLVMDDSTAIENGAFRFKGAQDTVFYRQLLIEKPGNREMVVPVILEKGKISVSYNGREATVGGTPQNDAVQQYIDLIRDAENALDSLYEIYAMNDDNLPLQQKIEEEYDSLSDELTEKMVDYIKLHNSDAAGALVFVQIYRMLDDEQQIEIMEAAGENFLCQPGIAPISERLEQMKKVAVGKPFVDLTMRNLDGNEAHLADFVGNGKYLVVDFWASWCRPCRQSMPELKEIYKRYAGKIEIVGVSFDSNEAAWKKCVADLELPWNHISDLKGWQSAASEVYGVDAIPHLMLIAPDGTIVAKKLNDESLAEKLEELGL